MKNSQLFNQRTRDSRIRRLCFPPSK
jgi:hypothetical protein